MRGRLGGLSIHRPCRPNGEGLIGGPKEPPAHKGIWVRSRRGWGWRDAAMAMERRAGFP